MTTCTHEKLVEGHYGHDCAACGVLVYPYGSEPWAYLTPEEEDALAREEAAYTDGRCETCGGEWGDGWSTCRCEEYEPLCCEHCGQELEYERCDQCEDGYSYHDCGEDCCCLDPEPNVRCEQCGGKGGWHYCTNRACPGKKEETDNE